MQENVDLKLDAQSFQIKTQEDMLNNLITESKLNLKSTHSQIEQMNVTMTQHYRDFSQNMERINNYIETNDKKIKEID